MHFRRPPPEKTVICQDSIIGESCASRRLFFLPFGLASGEKTWAMGLTDTRPCAILEPRAWRT